MKQLASALLLMMVFAVSFIFGLNAQSDSTTKVLVYEIKEEIAKPAWRSTQKAFEMAETDSVDYVLIHINTYGGRVDIADSIRTKILNSEIPVMAFIDNQAISAGALISISCDSIYMRSGGSIGAATVVSQSGEAVPDKYQSFMRSTMRATAEAHGKDTIIKGNDTIYKWHRDPKIAESMVDPRMYVPGVSDTGQVLTLTAEEALKVNYCEGLAKDIPEVLTKAGIKDAKLSYYKPEGIEIFIRFMLSGVVQGLLIMLIIGGIYFELQTPGVGFPLGIAAIAALLFFTPLYIEGLVENWELLVFVIGVILIGVEVFVIPGFGVTGLLGILLVLTGLTLSLVDNIVFEYEGLSALKFVARALLKVSVSIVLAFVLSIYLSHKVGTSGWLKGLGLDSVQQKSEGFVSIDSHLKDFVGKTGEAFTVLRPSGRVMIDNEIFDAKSEIGFIEKGEKIKVIKNETGQLYVIKVSKT
ncbi:MAG: nodulation protein NfeD [Bacteroidales bacterium]|nr:nodulation protein NfeD [Bacteroidales bacterium]MBN2819836.1 nodulation protein NfeD [Bacteroidales bacterium]